jgi:hypothetical protein
MVPPPFEREIIPPEGGGFRGLPPGLGRDLRIPRPMPGSMIGGPSLLPRPPVSNRPPRPPVEPIMRTMPVPSPGILPEIPRPDVGGGGRVSTMPVMPPGGFPRFPR